MRDERAHRVCVCRRNASVPWPLVLTQRASFIIILLRGVGFMVLQSDPVSGWRRSWQPKVESARRNPILGSDPVLEYVSAAGQPLQPSAELSDPLYYQTTNSRSQFPTTRPLHMPSARQSAPAHAESSICGPPPQLPSRPFTACRRGSAYFGRASLEPSSLHLM